ncbi:MAG: Glycosylphosphatidylinositol (GPI) anchor assembly protein [Claussenomyces sp. TS43310]|nr:MAG: Glycosylphosphatidylinositol (GPI) anchor assembly protein [Claussenomyces sp. TS43310]
MPLIDPVTMSSDSVAAQGQVHKASSPIEVLPTDLARIFTHLHPVLLLSAYYLRFPSLVADPVLTLATGLIPLAIVQTAYCIICLPFAGSTPRAAKKAQKSKGGAAKKSSPAATIFPILFSLLLTVAVTPIVLSIQILLGAPLTTHLPHTILSSLHLALLTLYPLFYVHGIDDAKWLDVCSAYAPLDDVFGGLVGAVLGAWLGAVPIPLDWDREWQRWPVTVVTGLYVGYVLGKGLGGSSLLRGKRIEFD